ncbi:uncharacterized protein BYT42DRAFT_577365 [Radiomyces spectabilis]|uniref:uncharacterized protein n=1 Tax=Radiomyces spectabilis TaxID=64574 RepID=UPI00221E7C80|nr:uncharacterized protein BYT42DRAFT_577365 [Radiomyces spectabilis]KAI8374713.1 hypothetical protein BYT42DRAFT_577365 [Radiomyces spectabilis]
MSNSGSTGSYTDSTGFTGLLGDTLQIPGYHFKAAPTPSLAHGENIDIVYGYKITNKKPVVAKVSPSSLRLEREFYIMKRLYNMPDGPSFLVRPLEYINLPSGITVVIYADEGQNYLDRRRSSDDTRHAGSERSSSAGSSVAHDLSESNLFLSSEARRRYRLHTHDACEVYSQGLPAGLPASEPAYDLGTFLRFAIKCTDCLEFIHRHNIVHGEIRLSAFQWAGDDGNRVKLWNFGSSSKSLETYLTSEGWRKTVMNKESMDLLRNLLVFMSPEQTGRTTYVPDHRSDIYSLGVVFFVLMTGRNPFDGGPLEILNGILSRKIPLVHEIQMDVPEIISRILEKMTSKSPDDRYSSAFGVRADLKECLRRLKNTSDTSLDTIAPFPLAEHDIASVFTLPKTIYGRQSVVVEMTYIIQRVAGLYKSMRYRRERSQAAVSSTLPTSDVTGSNASATESMSDMSSSHEVASIIGTKSVASPSYCSGLDGSDVSSGTSRAIGSSKQGTEIIALYGPGGVGKSTLFNAVQNVARQNGYVANTKFDARHKGPYGCILRSLSQILQQVLSESEEDIKQFYDHLKNHLGSGQFYNVELLADLVPELKPLLEPRAANSEPLEAIHLDNVETRVRFHNLFIEVFRALSHWRMVTLFLDDAHEADESSLELLKSLVSSRIKILLLVSYRDQEVTPKLTEILESDSAIIHFMKIEALSFDSLVEYIGDALHRPREVCHDAVLPLAEIVYKKTRGNAFYISQLITALEKKKLIFFNWEANEWDYNISEVQQEVIADSDSEKEAELDISFLVDRLRELPMDGQRLLKWASFVGNTFSWNTVKSLMLQSDPESEASDADTASDNTAKSDSIVVESLHPLIKFTHSVGGNRPNKKRMSTARNRDPISGLQAALQEGYILPLDSDEFKWTHDRYSQAAMELANPKMRAKIHLKIARHLIQDAEPDIFAVSDHLLNCLDLVIADNDVEQKMKYRSILIDSGNRARSSGAHNMALKYYLGAIQLLCPNAWETDDYTTVHHLYTNTASLSWIVADYEQTESMLQEIFDHGKTAMDRIVAYRIKSKYYFSRQMHEEGRLALYDCLRELGIEHFHYEATRENLYEEFFLVKKMIEDRGMDSLPAIPLCQDDRLKAIMGVVEELCTLAYWVGNQTEVFYLACKTVRFSLESGMAAVSGIGLVFMGLAAVEFYKLYGFAEELGAAGVAVSDRFGTNNEKGRAFFLYANFLLQWKYHYKEAMQWYRSGLRLSLAAGDRIYASFSHLHIATTAFYTGENLSMTLHEAEACYDEIHSWSTSLDTNILIMSVIRTIKALQGHTYTNDPNEIFNGDDGFNDAHFVSESCRQSANPDVPINWYDSFRLLPLVLYGHYNYAVAVGYMCIKGYHNHPCHRHTRLMLSLLSLAILEKLRVEDLDKEEYDMFMERVQMNQNQLGDWADHSSINYRMWWTLVEAEISSLGTNIAKTCQLFEDAINQCREGGWSLDLCIAHEYAGNFYVRAGMRNVAYNLVRKAIDLYMKHGSYGKARHLGVKHAQLLSDLDDEREESRDVGIQTDPFPFLDAQGAWSTSSLGNINIVNEPYASETIPPVTTEQTLMTLDILDMASILKSSQVMSSEVKFDGLLKSMINIILENSGADCGAIIVKEEKYGMCAYGSQQEGSMTFDPPRPLKDDDDLISSRIVHHTIHTVESIFVQNVEQDARFAVGPWFERAGNKSVICMPIIHKSALAGCLFLEGSCGIFTQRHITVLSLLCQQMGISITNAFLFKSVQRVTMANMRMIEMQKQALEDARKSKEAAVRATRLREIFLANMSHEIRTPFSGFYGMISLLAETRLDPEQSDLVKTAKESCEMLLQIIDDLLNFSKLQAGKVALDLSPVALEDIIADVVEMLTAMAVQKNINITFTVAHDVPPIVMADDNRLRQVIINLLGNAIKFTHEGEISIRCFVAEQQGSTKDTDGLVLRFEVMDTGIGISDEQRKVLFVPFSQVDGSTTRKYGGTGLGLSICLQLVQLMSGTIDVASVPGKGSNFFFTAKVGKVPKNVDCRDKVNKQREMQSMHDALSNIKVLVAARYASTIGMVRHILDGIHVDGVRKAEELPQNLAAVPYDVIILGLFLGKEFEDPSWVEKLTFKKEDTVMIIMHYPSGVQFQRNHWIEPVDVSVGKAKVIRMAVPLRRGKLLRAITDSMARSTPRPKKAVQSKANELISEEERAYFSTLHILIAEDNPVAQKLLLKQLTRLGFQVECANNGQEAVEAWLKHPVGYFTMAFFDHHMPVCDGVEATKRIRQIEKDENRTSRFAIVALTADVQESARKVCMKAGMDGYLTKPLNQKVLAEALRKYCHKPMGASSSNSS